MTSSPTRTAHRVPVVIDHVGIHPDDRPGKAAGHDRRNGVAADDTASGLRAAGVIDDRQLSSADFLEIPAPRLRVPGFAGRAKYPQG